MAVRTFNYKTVNGLAIRADVHRPDDTIARPVVMSIHGGALIVGCREQIDGRLHDMLLDAGYAVVSIDYRLAPETLLPGIIEDVEDAYKWILQEGPRLFNVDTARIAVVGGSAGGYLTLITGYRCQSRPAALISFFGYGDLIGSWTSSPSPHSRHHTTTMSEETAHALASGPPISDASHRHGDGGAFYQHCRQRGTWPLAISGWDPNLEAEAFHPYMPAVNVDASYPPTLLIHGTADTDVPYEQSMMMAEALARTGVDHALIPIDGGEHGLTGGQQQHIDDAYQQAFRFIERHLTPGVTV
jgi:acetyl esterase/lipase